MEFIFYCRFIFKMSLQGVLMMLIKSFPILIIFIIFGNFWEAWAFGDVIGIVELKESHDTPKAHKTVVIRKEDKVPQQELLTEQTIKKTSENSYVFPKWDSVLHDANRKEIANILNMLTSDSYYALLFLLDSIVVNSITHEKLLDEVVVFLDYPLEADWARELYKNHRRRVLEKEPDFWNQALKRLKASIEEDFLFSASATLTEPYLKADL